MPRALNVLGPALLMKRKEMELSSTSHFGLQNLTERVKSCILDRVSVVTKKASGFILALRMDVSICILYCSIHAENVFTT